MSCLSFFKLILSPILIRIEPNQNFNQDVNIDWKHIEQVYDHHEPLAEIIWHGKQDRPITIIQHLGDLGCKAV